jgi:hypothetical protein
MDKSNTKNCNCTPGLGESCDKCAPVMEQSNLPGTKAWEVEENDGAYADDDI